MFEQLHCNFLGLSIHHCTALLSVLSVKTGCVGNSKSQQPQYYKSNLAPPPLYPPIGAGLHSLKDVPQSTRGQQRSFVPGPQWG